MCTQAPAPAYTMCTQAPTANFKTPDWLRTGPNQSGAGAWVHIVYAGAGAWVHIMYAGAGAWVHILAPFALSVTRLKKSDLTKHFNSRHLQCPHCNMNLKTGSL